MQAESSNASLTLLICLTIFAVGLVIYTTRDLPETVATHFDGRNRANGWMSRDGYRLFTVSFMIGLSAFVGFCTGTLPRVFPRWTNIPHRDYWLARERREESLRYLSAHGKRLGCLIVLMMLGMHYVILVANHARPPTLPFSIFMWIFVGFLLALVWWIVRLYRRFPKPST